MSGESGYMPRNFAELKSGGGTIPMLSPHAEKWGGGGRVMTEQMIVVYILTRCWSSTPVSQLFIHIF